jgi:hypothetical protein
MNLEPVKQKVLFHEEGETLDRLLEVCDSYIAVLTPEQVDEWLAQFEKHVDFEFTDFGSATLVFDIGGKLLVTVSDSGGESASGEFYNFCEENNITCQFVIDSLDCTGLEVDEIYTGADKDNKRLLKLLHKVFN